jgi:phosphate transport system permease protein
LTAVAVPAVRQGRIRRRPRQATPADYGTMLGCALSAVALTWLVFARLTEGSGWFGFLVVAYFTFLLLYGLVTADRLGTLVAADRVVTVAVTTGAVVLLTPLVWLVGYVVVKGVDALRPGFFIEDQGGVQATAPATAGGGLHAIIGSLEQVALTLVMTVPLAVATAIFLNETRSWFRRPVRIFVDAMSGLPSIVAGLFIYAVFILPYAQRDIGILDFNGFMAALALTMIMLPTVTRTVEVVLRLVPGGLREASLALGSTRARSVWSVVLPTARTGVTTAVVLGIARAVGETAPLLFTAFGYDLLNTNPFRTQQESLPLFVYRNIQAASESARSRGFTGALVLLTLVLALFGTARFIGRDRTGRQARRSRRLPLPAPGPASPASPIPAVAPPRRLPTAVAVRSGADPASAAFREPGEGTESPTDPTSEEAPGP